MTMVSDRAAGPSGRRARSGFLVAAALLFAAAALQLIASLERWVGTPAAWAGAAGSVEDHLYDYSIPADPWVSLGSAAQLHGVGMLLVALGVVASDWATNAGADRLSRSSALTVAAVFVLGGAHALLSGILGAPTPLQDPQLQLGLDAFAVAALVVLALRTVRASGPAALSCILLLGSTLPGYLVATFIIAPMIAGYQSYDTTPGTESVVAACVAGAAACLLGAALRSGRV